VRIGVIGDVHLELDAVDVAQLDALGYDRLFFVGDLATYSHKAGLEVARHIARLETPALVIPGNHDAANVFQMAAEVLEADRLLPLLNVGQRARVSELAQALGRAIVAGYSVHRLDAAWGSVAVIAGRPHSAGSASGATTSGAATSARARATSAIPISSARCATPARAARTCAR